MEKVAHKSTGKASELILKDVFVCGQPFCVGVESKEGRGKRKYSNVRARFDDIWFDSTLEARHYIYLTHFQALKPDLQVEFIFACGVSYIADFVLPGRIVHEVKGSKAVETEAFKIKRKLFMHEYPQWDMQMIYQVQ